MIIEINDTKTIAEIRNEFSEYYPYLCIEFYDIPHGVQEITSYKHQYPHDKTIGQIRKKHNPGMLEIYSRHKTGMIEQEFQKLYGLNVQILRRQGNAWIQTAGTDELTLEEQNEIGRHATQETLHGTDRVFENEKRL